MNKRRSSDLWEGVDRMPPMHHTSAAQDYDFMRSEVAAWLVSRPGLREWIFKKAVKYGAIVYDPDSGTWRGSAVAKPAGWEF